MAGNRQVFEQAMRRGTNFAWDRQWQKAIAEYERAVAEFPDEAPAYTALGQALVHANRMREALKVYQQAARLTPDDPLALEGVAELQEQLGEMREAVRTWLHTADMHLRLQAVDPALQVWQHLVKIAPDTVSAHERLAKAYAGMSQTRKAIRQYLELAAVYQEKGEDDQARTACQKALELDPRDADVLTAVDALKHGRSVAKLVEDEPVDVFYISAEEGADEASETASPAEMTRQKALTELADALLEDSGFGDMELTALLLQAIDYQTRGDIESAITTYEKAIATGATHVAARFNLGALYQETLEFDAAVEQFQLAMEDRGYALGAHFALGECLRAQGRVRDALTHFVQVLKQLDLSTVGPENADVLRQVYDDLARSYSSGRQREMMNSFMNAMVEFLSGERWEDRLFETRQQLNRLGNGKVISIAEILALPNSELVLSSMVRSRDYFEQGMLRSSSEECLWAIEHAPEYLPLHLHLANLFMQGNRVDAAISKYLFAADTLAAREEMEQAMALYEKVLSMAPMDLKVRRKLILLLREHAMIEQALEHQLALADAYYELAQIEASREEYAEALQVASRSTESKKWMARILHRLADIDMQRLDWRSAIDVYSQLKAAVPEDIKARQRLVDLYFNLQRRAEAANELDELVRLYRSKGDLAAARDAVEEISSSHPDNLELHKRAAQLCVETGQKEQAIMHLDAMGELQLQAGRAQEAVATIKAIVALGPENVEAYRQLLEQIV